MQKGKINVQTENIFPIIKKFLYSDHEIFLRELISNAVDATQKLKTLASLGEFKGEMGDLTIQVDYDAKEKIIRITDRGIGMTAEEVNRYINQIAFSGAEEFLKQYKGKTDEETAGMIGHFGLGFYSAFMVADEVEFITKSHKEGSQAVKWACDGSPEFTLTEVEKEDRGTEIILHISEDSIEFAEEYRLLNLLKKYCKFLPVPIQFRNEKEWVEDENEKDEKGEPKRIEIEKPRVINNTTPLWKKMPADLKDEDYKTFYRELYPASMDEPLFNIHLNVDYPFNLTGILYFPKVKQNYEIQRDKIQLYCNQVFVTDSVEGIVPDFLTLLHGVIDSPDIPLNVSRSYLQSDSSVKKISNHIMKKVSDKLEEIYKNDREEFEKKWDDIKIFITYGMISETKFYDRAKKYALLKTTEGKYFNFDEYVEHIKENQTDKEKKIVALYTTNLEQQHGYIASAKEHGYDVIILDSPIDAHFVNHLEQNLENVTFSRVDADVIDKLIVKEDPMPNKLSEDEQNKLRPLFVQQMKNGNQFQVQFESMSENEMPVIITQPEFMRRMKDMSRTGGMEYMAGMPDSYNLVVNTNHALVNEILKEEDEAHQADLIKQLTDLALLSQNMLSGESLTAFLKRSVNMIK